MVDTQQNFDNFAKVYDSILENQLIFFDEENTYFAEYKVLKLKEILKKSPKTILDFGCGVGRSAFFLKKHFLDSEIWGCDISELSLVEARKRYSDINFFHINALKLTQLKFELIFVANVFHHIAPEQRLSSMHEILNYAAPEAMVVVFEHNPLNPVTRFLVNTCPFDKGVFLLWPKELKNLFSSVGIKNIKSEYTLFFPAIFKKLRGCEKYLTKFPFGGQYLVSGTI